jgi:DNA-binding MarR family transcriptional regulator
MDDRLIFLISKAGNMLKNFMIRECINGGVVMSSVQAGMLMALKISNGLSMNQLSEIISIDNAAVTRHVDTLEKSGMVKRESDADDRRKIIVRITTEGIAEADRAKAVARRVNSMIKEGFTEQEVEIFKRILSSFFIKFK